MKNCILFAGLISSVLFSACGGSKPAANADAASAAQIQTIGLAERPRKVTDLMTQRGEQDAAAPILKIVEPKANAILNGAVVKVKIDISGDLRGYMPQMDMETKMGNHIHVILDNQPYEAYYDLGREFELRNVADGEHTIRVFPSRPWHESYKNEGAFQMVRFSVKKGGADTSKPTTANGSPMSDAPTPEGKEMKLSTAGPVDITKPLLTYSRPKGEYKGDEANAIMIDFWLSNAKLAGDGGEYRVRYTVDNGEPRFIDKWEPVWLSGLISGRHVIGLELVDKEGRSVDNGGYNTTVRDFLVLR